MTAGPDFLRPVARPGLLAWAWCATGLLVLAVAVADAAVAWAGRQQAVQARQAIERPVRAATSAPRRDARTAGAVSDAAAQRAAAQRWLQQLAHPWPQVWAASEAASEPGIAWLVLEHSVQGALRLEGLAPDEGPAQRAAQVLRDAAGPAGPLWQQVALMRTERVAGGQRFEITAQRWLGPVGAATALPAASATAAATTTASTAATREATPGATPVASLPLSTPAAAAVAMTALVDGGTLGESVR